jgi:hypothetical protein
MAYARGIKKLDPWVNAVKKWKNRSVRGLIVNIRWAPYR